MVVNSSDLLKEAGFSDYEARAYLELIKTHPITAYETARLSGIPSSKIYGLLERMKEKGLVLEILEQDKKLYVPLEVQDFIESQRSRVNRNLDLLQEQLEQEKQGDSLSYIWNIKTQEKLTSKAVEMIEGACHEILLSLWPQEFQKLLPLLKCKEEQGIRIALVHFGEVQEGVGQMYRHPIEDTLIQEKGGRSFAMVCDSRTALMGTLNDQGGVDASWSRSTGFTALAEDYIRHDIYIMKIVERFDKELIEAFGENYPLLRDVFQNKKEEL